VEEVADAELISRACRFPPHGQRSQLAMVPQYGMRPTPASELNPALDAATIVQILLETPKASATRTASPRCPGWTCWPSGCNDLTAELGIPGQYGHSAVREAIATVGEACTRHGKLLMVGGISDRSVVDSLPELGVSPVHLTGFDTDLLFAAARPASPPSSNPAPNVDPPDDTLRDGNDREPEILRVYADAERPTPTPAPSSRCRRCV